MPKALVRLSGELLVDRSMDVLRAAGCDPVVVVLGAAADEVRTRAAFDGAVAVDNPDWVTGMGSSLRTGLAALADTGAVAAAVVLVDMPGVTAAAVRRVGAGAGPADLVMAGYGNGRSGHPVLLGRDHWAGVAALALGDVGARPYLQAHATEVRVVPCADVVDDGDLDVDHRRAAPG